MATAAQVCSLENYLVLPDHTMDDRISAARQELGRDVVILGHHYQRDEVIRFADFRGDSYKLAQEAAATAGKYIVFCGVHFMAESADILARRGQTTILPDLNAGCSMADMAEITQVEDCWENLVRAGLTTDEPEDSVPARSASRAQHRLQARCPAQRDGGLGPVHDQRRPNPRAPEERQSDSVERPLLSPSTLSPGTCRQRPRQVPRHKSNCASRVPLGSLPESRRHRLHGRPAQDDPAIAIRCHVRRRH